MIKEWLYFANDNIIDKIESGLSDIYDIEVWRELGVIEINNLGGSIDMEIIDQKRWDDFCASYVKDNGFNNLWQVTLGKDSDDWAMDAMKKICELCGGRFCADTEDLTPVIE